MMRQATNVKQEEKQKVIQAEEARKKLIEEEEDAAEEKAMQDGKIERMHWERKFNQCLFDPEEYFIKGNPSLPREAGWVSI